MNPVNAVLGELPAVFAGSGVVRAPSRAICCGICRGMMGEEEELPVGSVVTNKGGDAVLWLSDGSSEAKEGDSFRFL